jgi:phage terminase large subunit GpA-like protein
MTATPAMLDLLGFAAEAARPPPRLTVSEWAEAHRSLPDDEPEPGPWRNARTPYLVEIMNALGSYDPAEEVVLMKGCQLGGTETILNAIGYWIEHAPGRIMAVQINDDNARDFSRQRITPLIDLNPVLSERVKGGADNVLLKEFPGGSLRTCGANAPANLRSKPCRYVVGDEIDGWTEDSGGEGDPLYLLEKRQGNFADAKRLLVSTPNVKQTSRIEKRWLAGSRETLHVPCPDCGELHLLEWANFIIPKDEEGAYLPDEAAMSCPHCGSVFENEAKAEMLRLAVWRRYEDLDEPGKAAVRRAVRVSSKQCRDTPQTRWRRSFHLSSLYSPVGWLDWAKVAEEWIRCKDDPIELKAFLNQVLGQSWDQEDGESVDENELYNRREHWDEVPEGVLIVTAGGDLQIDRAEIEIVGWGVGHESWSLDYVTVLGDPTSADLWRDVDAVLKRKFAIEDGRTLTIEASCVDSSFEADAVYTFCKPRWRRHVWAVKGASDEARVKREIWPSEWNKSKRRDGKFKLIGTSRAKSHVYTRLSKPSPGPGYCHFPHDRRLEWFEQLTVERRVIKYRHGFRIIQWHKPKHRSNEALDCRVYAYAALHGLAKLNRTLEDAQKAKERRAVERGLDSDRAHVQDPTVKRRKRRREWFDDKTRDWFEQDL